MKRIAALVLIFMLIMSATAFAEKTSVYAARVAVPVYASKSTGAKVIATLYYGQKATCANFDDFTKGWAKLTGANRVGYCRMEYLTDDNPNDLDITLKAASSGAKVYAAPNESAKVLVRMAGGAKVTVKSLTPNCAWWRVKVGEKLGYMKAASLTGGAKQYYTGTVTAIKKGGGKQVGVLCFGEGVRVLASRGDKRLIRRLRDGKMGYVNSGDFAAENPCDAEEKAFVAADGVKLYKIPQAKKSNSIKTLKLGDKVTVLGGGAKVGFFAVKCNGYNGYILANCLVAQKPEGRLFVTVSDDGKLYTDNKGSAVICELNKGDKVKLIQVSNNAAKVKTSSNQTGWCKLKLIDPN